MVNESAVDRWTWVHALNGMGLGLLNASPLVAIGLAAAYEVAEWHHERHGSRIFGTKRPESWANIAGDTVAYAGAYVLGRRAPLVDAPPLGVLALGAAGAVTWMLSPLGGGKSG